MENVRIFARPKAYELLTNPSEGERLKPVVEQAIALARDDRRLDGAFLNPLECGIRARWAKEPTEESVILIYSFQDQEENGYNLLDPAELGLAIKDAIPIMFLD